MPSIRFAIATAFIVATLGMQTASALEVQDGSGKAGVNLTDPDDNVPVAHLGDDGKVQPSSSGGFNVQLNGGGNPYSRSGGNAFDRAQQNQMGQ